MPKPLTPPLPPEVLDGRDSFPFTVVHGHWRDPVSRWYDAIITSASFGIQANVGVEGYHPSHTMMPFGAGVACEVCGCVDSTQGGVMPCEYDLRGRTPLEAAKDERALAVEALNVSAAP